MKNILKSFIKSCAFFKALIISGLIFNNPVNSQLDRSVMPESGPPPEIFFGKPNTFKLDNGLTIMVVENSKLPRASASLSFDNPLIFEGEVAGVSTILGEMIGNGTQSISKEKFLEEVDFMGASMSVSGSGAFASSLSRYFPRVLELMADAVLNPLLTQEEFDSQKNLIKESLKTTDKDVATAASRVQDLITYGRSHPNGEFVSQETLDKSELNDAIDFYNNYASPKNAFLVILGDVNFGEIKERVTKLFSAWESKEVISKSFPEPTNPENTEIIFIDMPNGVQAVVSVINTIDFNKKKSDYFSALVANRILGGGGAGRLFNNLREDKGWTYGSYSGVSESYKTKGYFTAQAQVRNEVADSAAIELLKEVDKMRNTLVSDDELSSAKAKYTGNFVMSLEDPSTIASFARNIITQDLPKDYYNGFLEKINSVTKEDVKSAAEKYFLTNKTRVFITGKGSEIIDALDGLKYNGKELKIRYYDKFGNKIEKPNYSVIDNINAEGIVSNYLNLIGGIDRLKEVQSIETLGNANLNMQGQTFSLEFYTLKNYQNQSLATVTAGGMIVQKSVFNKYQGYNEVNGQRIPLTDSELDNAIINSALFSELNYDFSKIKLVGTSIVNDQKVYEIKISDNKTEYYSVQSGLKVKEIQTTEVEGNQIVLETTINKYEEVEGVLIPSEINQITPALPIPGGITIKFAKIKLDVKTSDSDFN